MDQNINFAKCLKDSTDFGATHVHNVCTGTIQHVPWGSADWALAVGLGGFFVAIVLMFGAMGISMIRGF